MSQTGNILHYGDASDRSQSLRYRFDEFSRKSGPRNGTTTLIYKSSADDGGPVTMKHKRQTVCYDATQVCAATN